MTTRKPLPYFDFLLDQIAQGNESLTAGFGHHVHWGYWPDPRSAACDDAGFALAAERLTGELCELAELSSGQRVLDAGCGFGGTVNFLNAHYHDMDLVGLNIDPRQLERAQQLTHPLPGNRIVFCGGDACALPFADASFDRVMAVECIFHFPSRRSFLQEAWRVLRPGGMLVLSDFVPAGVMVPVMAAIDKTAWYQRLNYFGPCNVRCSSRQYRRLTAECGFELSVARDVTRNIMPTYRYLKGMIARMLGIARLGPTVSWPIAFMQALGHTGMLNYHLLAMRKTDGPRA
ncbi:MAG: class I SAM-dependent methyltransferase [Rhodocyclaceae bacterium]|nr:class I SAM-dependent methyltransferase [Rhodocyclaceae bacterium]MBX3667207.1 class I SAM-dependent methyltransferase [Rhodocyclaceae bacterium]